VRNWLPILLLSLCLNVEAQAATASVDHPAFSAFNQAMATGNKANAADALLVILDNEAKILQHSEAWMQLGDLLTGLNLPYAGYLAYTKTLESDPDKGVTRLPIVLQLAEQVGDEAHIAPHLGSTLTMASDSQTRSQAAVLFARHQFQQTNYEDALTTLALVDKKSSYFADAQALTGNIHSQMDRFSDALVPFLTAEQAGKNSKQGQRFADVQALNLGRAYFAVGNFPKAMQYYAKVSRGSSFWIEANFERAWAHFRVEDMTGTLALLHNHNSPFFEDWYFPEADLLRTYALFLLCKFPDAGKDIDRFIEVYTPVRQGLGQLDSLTPTAIWQDYLNYREDKPARLPIPIYRAYRYQDRINDALLSLQIAQDEIDRLQAMSTHQYQAKATQWLQTRQTEIGDKEGSRIQGHAQKHLAQLKDLLTSVQITKLDIMQYETRLYERASYTGEIEFGDKMGRVRKERKRRNTRTWPFQGEYWADELGYFRYKVRPDCPENLRAANQ